MFVDLCERLNLKRHVTLLRADRTVPPMTWGAWHPVVVLPTSSQGWTPARHQAVLMHELAHVKRYDWLSQTLAQLATALYWFNPLVWVAVRRLLNEQEVACDDQVLVAGANASDYAQSLLEVVQSLRSGEWSVLATTAMARHSTLEGRLVAILDPNRSRQGLYTLRVLVSTALVCSMVIPLAAMQPWTTSPTDVEAEPQEQLAENLERSINPLTGLAARQSETERQDDVELLPEASDQSQPVADVLNRSENASQQQPGSRSEQVQDSTKVLALIEALKDEDAEVRRVAVWALGDIEDTRAVPALMQVLTSDSDSDVRSKAAWALGKIEDARAIQALEQALEDENADVRRQAARALGEIEDVAAVGALNQALVNDAVAGVRRMAAWALGEIESGESTDALAQALDDEDDDVRRTAAWALGELEDPKAVEPLMRLVRRTDIDAEVRASAIHALGEIEDPRSAGVFVELLTNDTSAEVRRRAAWALGEMEVSEGVEPLIQALKDSDAEVRSIVVWALGEIEDARAVVPLTQLLQDSNTEVRRKVLWALGEMGDERAVSSISTALKDDDAEVRSMAAWALGEIEGTEAVSALIGALQDPEADVRLKVAWALGEIGDARAAEPLMQVLQNDSSKEVRRQAARALADLD
jgi:HEAT repeat protein